MRRIIANMWRKNSIEYRLWCIDPCQRIFTVCAIEIRKIVERLKLLVAEYMIDKGATELRDASLHALTIKI